MHNQSFYFVIMLVYFCHCTNRYGYLYRAIEVDTKTKQKTPLLQGQPDSPSESRTQWLGLCGDIYRGDMDKTDHIKKLCKYRWTWEHNLKSNLFLSADENVLQSGRLAITSPVVCKPTQIQEEWHRLCPAAEYFLAVNRLKVHYMLLHIP